MKYYNRRFFNYHFLGSILLVLSGLSLSGLYYFEGKNVIQTSLAGIFILCYISGLVFMDKHYKRKYELE
jgi:hypothetical protein